jgi:ketosteroid isomerase-like protein
MPLHDEEVARAFVAAINAGDLDALRALMTDDHVFTDAKGNSFRGADHMILGWKLYFNAYPNYAIVVDRVMSQAGFVALFGGASGGWRLDGTVVKEQWKVSAAWLAQIVDGRVRHWTVYCDTSWVQRPDPASPADAA